ncbi:MAG: exostosin family protein, partial [Candidatus Thorarchaeota archaeon]
YNKIRSFVKNGKGSTMKFYILSVEAKFQPDLVKILYPNHNDNYGIEQDFLRYLQKNKYLVTEDIKSADWHYLPIYWTSWHLNHNYGKEGLVELQESVREFIVDDDKTFTICQYDDGPLVDIGKTKIFFGSRKKNKPFDAPLLCRPHRIPILKPKKKYLACFVGRVSTHSIRQEMADLLKQRADIFLYDGNNGSRFFIRKLLESYLSLCPRGYGGSSFRFYESMQLGVVPLLIGDIDTRPFKEFINWDEVSLYLKSPKNLEALLETLDRSNLLKMGKKASIFWKRELSYQRWCKYVIKELEGLN